jgi:orotate phosphoribosyltransferase
MRASREDLGDPAVLAILQDTGALLQGHFLLRSGLHSRVYVQCARVLQYPWLAEELCQKLLPKVAPFACDSVLSTAYGGIPIGHELGRLLRLRHLFTEKDQGKLLLRRFSLHVGERVLVAEDVVTTGSAIKETIRIAQEAGAVPVAVACLVDRSVGPLGLEIPLVSLIRLPLEVYSEDNLPQDLKAIPAVKPGSS